MPADPVTPPKPVTAVVRPEITRLPVLHLWRRLLRKLLVGFSRLLVRLFVRPEVSGLENIPLEGPAVVISNHLGDADLVIGLAFTTRTCEVFAKAELYDFPVLGRVMDAFGVIWVHRGQPDRRALRIGLECLQQGRLVGIAPEARESVTGGLEEGTPGAAYLALKAGVPLLPVTFTGTQNQRVYANMRRLRRTPVTMTVGRLFKLEESDDRRQVLQLGTEQIMRHLAAQLPVAYQGAFRDGTG